MRNNVFDKFFTLEHTVHLAEGGEQLNRECSLFSECGRFVIVGSACYLPDEPHPPMHEIYRQVFKENYLDKRPLLGLPAWFKGSKLTKSKKIGSDH